MPPAEDVWTMEVINSRIMDKRIKNPKISAYGPMAHERHSFLCSKSAYHKIMLKPDATQFAGCYIGDNQSTKKINKTFVLKKKENRRFHSQVECT